jgi:hypothetical protein
MQRLLGDAPGIPREFLTYSPSYPKAFSELLWAGVYNYSYVAKATTPGEFIAPPPKAEEMYHPETFGRGASERVVVGNRVHIERLNGLNP